MIVFGSYYACIFRIKYIWFESTAEKRFVVSESTKAENAQARSGISFSFISNLNNVSKT